MEGESKHQNAPTQRPKNYKQMVYAPVKKIESEDKLAQLEQTSLQHSYTYWVMVQEQKFSKKKDKQDTFEDELREIETVDTVSTLFSR